MSQRTRAQIATDIAAKLADNTSEAITEAKLREVLTDLNDSAYNASTDGAPTAGAHTHAQSDITGLTAALAGKAASSHTHAISEVSGLQSALDGKQAAGSYAPSSHSHAISDVTGLSTVLDNKADTSAVLSGLSGKADTVHTHTQSEVTGLSTALAGKSDTGHTHSELHTHPNKTALDKRWWSTVVERQCLAGGRWRRWRYV
jgi:hypothetical protein